MSFIVKKVMLFGVSGTFFGSSDTFFGVADTFFGAAETFFGAADTFFMGFSSREHIVRGSSVKIPSSEAQNPGFSREI